MCVAVHIKNPLVVESYEKNSPSGCCLGKIQGNSTTEAGVVLGVSADWDTCSEVSEQMAKQIWKCYDCHKAISKKKKKKKHSLENMALTP